MDQPSHMLKCSLKMTAVLIFMCALTSQAPSRQRRSRDAINITIRDMHKMINTSANKLVSSGVNCSTLKETEVAGVVEEPLTPRNLSLFRCYMSKMSSHTRECEHDLQMINQYSADLETLWLGSASDSECSLPRFEQDKDKYEFVHCLLELLDKVLDKI